VPIQGSSEPPRLVQVGIDAAVVAQHEVCIRATDAQGGVRPDRFRLQPTGRIAITEQPADGSEIGKRRASIRNLTVRGRRRPK
jgi:hypothetical protein